ncbi:choline BCCT transporter BetT [Gleimia hominis]|uniref:choline BCCT transporter BetT n=1 Tax=Gleimia hominis TaxID=595468 RepID=UPI000C8069CC|nr:choline BCCT transporter BetT [Gleimia hominis]WIK64703.1 choline BCCT transporter BetT [Gleimia hominis]
MPADTTQATQVQRTDDLTPKTQRLVLAGSAVFTLAVALWAFVSPKRMNSFLEGAVTWISTYLGWFYILLGAVVLVFVVYIALRYSRVRLGKDTDRPEYSTLTWGAMLFAAGIGTDVMFFAVAEPASHFVAPPQGAGGTIDAARQATVWMMHHYGLVGWGMYVLMGMTLGYFAHRHGLPLAVRSALYPLIGKRVKGAAGHAVDIATVTGTIFGVAASLGIGVVMLNVGLDMLFGVEQGLPAQVGLVIVAVVMATVSATTGVDKGIRVLSQLNVLLAIAICVFVLIADDTAFLLRAMVMNIGDFISMFPGMTLDTMAYNYPTEWMSAWTLFFWAWWIAWASFVGMFLARISRGRTIGQFVLGCLTIPFSYIVMWATIFGNAAIKRIQSGDSAFGELALTNPEQSFFTLLSGYPFATAIIGLATFVGLLFYVTSADSGALVMANLCSKLPAPEVDAKSWLRIFWAGSTAVLTIAMLTVDGVPALQNATVIMGLPFAFVMIFVMVGFLRALRSEQKREAALMTTVTSQVLGRTNDDSRGSWQARLSRQLTGVSPARASRRMQRVVIPALQKIARELQRLGANAQVDISEVLSKTGGKNLRAELYVTSQLHDDFLYAVQVHRVLQPVYGGGRVSHQDDTTCRLQVSLPTGVNYNIYDYTEDQVCHDVLDHYERWVGTEVRLDLS